MWTRQRKSRRYGSLIVPAITALVLTYFGYHAFHGDYGINAARQLEMRTAELEQELAGLRADRARLEHRIALLRDGSLERDMVDEHARRVLNVAHPDELVIYRTKSN
jgi:cell division protein FtsB